MFLINSQVCIKGNILNSSIPSSFRVRLTLAQPGALARVPCIPAAPGALCTLTWAHQLPPPLGKSLWGCFSSGRQIHLLWPLSQLAMPSHRGGSTQNLSFPHVFFLALHPMAIKGERGPKDQGRKNGKKGETYFPLIHLKFILHSSLWEELVCLICLHSDWVLGLIKKNYNLKEIKVATKFFSLSLKSQNRFKEEL